MLLYLSMLDTQEEKDKFTELYEQYQHFCWYVANQQLGTPIWLRMRYRKLSWR